MPLTLLLISLLPLVFPLDQDALKQDANCKHQTYV